MNPGKLDRRITFQQATTSRSTNGESVDTWTTYATRWAALEYGTGSEGVTLDRLLPSSVVRFTVRYDSAITKRMRIRYNHVYYAIVHMVELGRQDYWMLNCETTDDEESMTVDSTLLTADSNIYTADSIRY